MNPLLLDANELLVPSSNFANKRVNICFASMRCLPSLALSRVASESAKPKGEYPFGFADSLATLDRARLGKQRIEAKQILTLLLAKLDDGTSSSLASSSRGFINHPATRMWEGNEILLAYYYNCSIN